MNGEIIDPDDEDKMTEVNYTQMYTPKYKKVEDMYVPEEDDEVISMDESQVLIKNTKKHVIKRVLTEDYLTKDIRRAILDLRK